ncbi:MAG: nicotinate-nucleotide diphosphorylase (carboxylating), partial [Ignavibacteria bacterium]|nr:nicotinate-nucleotide diphosphorylase (carboxylating) [Ignavibacteria bacterium]
MKITEQTKKLISLSLDEDIGSGDITTKLVVGNKEKGTAELIVKSEGIICGIEVAKYICRLVSKRLKFVSLVKDGDKVLAISKIAQISGPYNSLLTVERTLLNFMQRMSGIATETN